MYEDIRSSSSIEKSTPRQAALFIHQGSLRFLIPIEFVVEIMRPLPIISLEGQPAYLNGLSIVRGAAIPVFDLGRIVGAAAERGSRLVSMLFQGRPLALQVETVLGVYPISQAQFQSLPSVLKHAASEVIESLNTLDSQILMSMRPWRVLSEEAWQSLEKISRTYR